jgi:hypothetical protein
VSGEDAARGDANGGDASGGGVTGDEAAWRDLVARFSLPADPAAAPWPDREDLTPDPAGPGPAPRPAAPADGQDPAPADGQGSGSADHQGSGSADRQSSGSADRQGSASGGHGPAPADGLGSAGDRSPAPADPLRGAGADRARVIRPATSASPAPIPASPLVPRQSAETAEDEEHFVPPPPPPLPHLDSVAKGAWTALFGGPAYLLFATLMGWTVPGWAALLAVMAFVGGFATVVLRLGDGPSRGSGPDNGAVL